MHGAQCNLRNAQAPRGSSEPAIRRASSPPLPCREVIHARLESVHRGQPIWMCWFYGFLGAQSSGSGPNPLPGDGRGHSRASNGSGAERTEIAIHAQNTANKQETKQTTDDATKGTTTTADNASSDKGQGQDATPRCHRPLPAGRRLDDCELYRHSCCGRLADTVWDRHSAPRTAVVVV